MNTLTQYDEKVREIKASDMDFSAMMQALKNERAACVAARTAEMMAMLDYSKHDERNSRQYVERALTAHYSQCLDSTMTATQFDARFAVFSPYGGTY